MKTIVWMLLLLLPVTAGAQEALEMVTVTQNPDGGESYSVTIQLLLLMTVFSFLPAVLVMMTSFTRIVIVLSILKQAVGLQQAPSSQIIIGLALFLTFFIMAPVFDKIHANAITPYFEEQINFREALVRSSKPLREFMLAQTRENDLGLFTEISGKGPFESHEDIPFSVLLPSFVTSELKTAFQMGFLIFIPFLIIDLVVASVLMSMGMMMLSPMLVSLPFKIMLFVLVDGWPLIMSTLASSFYI